MFYRFLILTCVIAISLTPSMSSASENIQDIIHSIEMLVFSENGQPRFTENEDPIPLGPSFVSSIEPWEEKYSVGSGEEYFVRVTAVPHPTQDFVFRVFPFEEGGEYPESEKLCEIRFDLHIINLNCFLWLQTYLFSPEDVFTPEDNDSRLIRVQDFIPSALEILRGYGIGGTADKNLGNVNKLFKLFNNKYLCMKLATLFDNKLAARVYVDFPNEEYNSAILPALNLCCKYMCDQDGPKAKFVACSIPEPSKTFREDTLVADEMTYTLFENANFDSTTQHNKVRCNTPILHYYFIGDEADKELVAPSIRAINALQTVRLPEFERLEFILEDQSLSTTLLDISVALNPPSQGLFFSSWMLGD